MNKKLLIISAVIATTVAVSTSSESQDEMVINRQWIDKIPQGDTDVVNIFVTIDDGIGATIKASQWVQYLDLFLWEKQANSLRATFPQDNKDVVFKYSAWECDHPPFELCMEMNGKKYYSRWDWEMDEASVNLEYLETP